MWGRRQTIQVYVYTSVQRSIVSWSVTISYSIRCDSDRLIALHANITNDKIKKVKFIVKKVTLKINGNMRRAFDAITRWDPLSLSPHQSKNIWWRLRPILLFLVAFLYFFCSNFFLLYHPHNPLVSSSFGKHKWNHLLTLHHQPTHNTNILPIK